MGEIVDKVVVDPGFGKYKFGVKNQSFSNCKNNKAVVRGTWKHLISKITGGNQRYKFFKDCNKYSYSRKKDKLYSVKLVSRKNFSCVEN